MEVAPQMFPGVKPHIERVRNVKTGGRDQWRLNMCGEYQRPVRARMNLQQYW
jgi:hypothetical protein